jgi:hypothetical protein
MQLITKKPEFQARVFGHPNDTTPFPWRSTYAAAIKDKTKLVDSKVVVRTPIPGAIYEVPPMEHWGEVWYPVVPDDVLYYVDRAMDKGYNVYRTRFKRRDFKGYLMAADWLVYTWVEWKDGTSVECVPIRELNFICPVWR